MKILSMASVMALLLVPAMGQAEESQDARRIISVSAEVQERVAPDKADIDVNISEQHPKLTEAKAQADKKLATLREIARAADVPEQDLKTTYSTIQPSYFYRDDGRRAFQGYVVSYAVQMTIRKLDKVGLALDKLVSAGFEEVNNVQYGLQEEDAARSAAVKKAVLRAKEKAAMIAAALGESLGHAVSVQEGNVTIQPIQPPMIYGAAKMSAMAEAAPADAASSPPPAGQIAVSGQVQASFELK